MFILNWESAYKEVKILNHYKNNHTEGGVILKLDTTNKAGANTY